ncbi:LOB domain-containing protein 21-like [Salvia hispanica]|uniref:LOB domain-containing protein 21-like n=1 Tax=Salvia hispanica TaxID=49212 RepID=UPI0020090B3C|nr:LOB domain-containing protein 21-like [Salvia hispanica]
MKSQEPRSSSSCAACKFLKRRCTPNCQFAPYFRSDEPKKFAKVHKVFGASNVSKILNEVPEEHREDAVNSLVFEAEVRLQDPVYGCIGAIASLQHKMVELQHDLFLARSRLACFLDHQPPPPPPAPFFDDMPPLFDPPMPDLFDQSTLPLDHFAPFHYP